MTPYSLRFSFVGNAVKLKAELGHTYAPKHFVLSGAAVTILGQFIGLHTCHHHPQWGSHTNILYSVLHQETKELPRYKNEKTFCSWEIHFAKKYRKL